MILTLSNNFYEIYPSNFSYNSLRKFDFNNLRVKVTELRLWNVKKVFFERLIGQVLLKAY